MLIYLLPPALVVAAALLTQPQAEPPAITDTVILLPDEDGTVGSLLVSSEGAEQSLDTAYSTVKANENGALAAGTTSAAEVEAEFGSLLAATPAAPRSFTVTFESGSADTLTSDSLEQVAEIRDYLSTLPAAEITVIGHTDRVGSLEDNDALSRQRARSVKRLIQSAGIDAADIEVSGRGEREPLVSTADGVAEPRNRRVEIRIR